MISAVGSSALVIAGTPIALRPGMTIITLPSNQGDATMIRGIHEACDQWCAYCPVTGRCLAFDLTGADPEYGIWTPCEDEDGNGNGVAAGITFFKALADAEGRLAPPEIEAIACGDRDRQRRMLTLDDPLEKLGRRYMTLAEAYLASRPDTPAMIGRREGGPTPLEVLAWFHVLAPARIFRAILSAEESAAGIPGRDIDALIAAKVALVGIDRSLAAIAALAADDEDPRLPLLAAQLRQLRQAVDARFPAARAFVRVGLDAPAPTRPGALRTVLDRLWQRIHGVVR